PSQEKEGAREEQRSAASHGQVNASVPDAHRPGKLIATRLADVLPRIGDAPGEGARGDGVRAGEENLRLLVAHAAREVPVRRADAIHRRIQAPKGIHRTTEAGRAGRILGEADARALE